MWDAATDLVFGTCCLGCRRPGTVLCDRCATGLPRSGQPTRPDPCPDGLVPTMTGGPYESTLKDLILAHKERGTLRLDRPLGRVLAGVVRSAVPIEALTLAGVVVVLVPVPSRRAATRARGHDPTLRLVRVAAARLRSAGADATVLPLLETRPGLRDQAGLGADRRRANVAGRLRIAPAALAALRRLGHPAVVVLCDDIVTTGVTLREAQRALADRGIGVSAAATLASTRRSGTKVTDPVGSLPKGWAPG